MALPPWPGARPAAPLSQTCGLSTRELSEGFPAPRPQDVLVLERPPLPGPGVGQPVCPASSPLEQSLWGWGWWVREASSSDWSLFSAELPAGQRSLWAPIRAKVHTFRPLPVLLLLPGTSPSCPPTSCWCCVCSPVRWPVTSPRPRRGPLLSSLSRGERCKDRSCLSLDLGLLFPRGGHQMTRESGVRRLVPPPFGGPRYKIGQMGKFRLGLGDLGRAGMGVGMGCGRSDGRPPPVLDGTAHPDR